MSHQKELIYFLSVVKHYDGVPSTSQYLNDTWRSSSKHIETKTSSTIMLIAILSQEDHAFQMGYTSTGNPYSEESSFCVFSHPIPPG